MVGVMLKLPLENWLLTVALSALNPPILGFVKSSIRDWRGRQGWRPQRLWGLHLGMGSHDPTGLKVAPSLHLGQLHRCGHGSGRGVGVACGGWNRLPSRGGACGRGAVAEA
ncbi:hypothetical protein Taro_014031 [Colocasia esculenta]|uniref:Uncharacterized protein n=1 Tax=Colocasia esculenta TaxID=4460 RepID=A0A843UDS3_COLES|nr:hypothetical protein [Colocasia esculenta]